MNETYFIAKNEAKRRRLNRPTTTVAFLALVLASVMTGCSTPIHSTDNPVLLWLPGMERKSDNIPGFVTPSERIKLIEEKGKKGIKSTPEEKDLLLVQLVQEYEKTNSPHIKRAALEAIARISSNYANPAAEKIFQSALEDEDVNLNLSAANALAVYASKGQSAKDNKEQRKLAIHLLAERYRSLPFSIEAGAEEENAKRKDVRIAILHALGEFQADDSPELYETLEFALTGEKLDDGALEATACSSLEKISGMNYGIDGEKWIQYIAYTNGEGSAPSQTSIIERAPKVENVTGIFK